MTGFRFEGCAIISADGMLADASGNQPPELFVKADQDFFDAKLDAADLIVHGRNSKESHRNSPNRRRIYATHRVAAIAPHPDNPNALRWNPAGASIDEAARQFGVHAGLIAVIGGTEVFDLFLPRYDVFWLTCARRAKLPGGVPVFSGIPPATADGILEQHGLKPMEARMLDPVGEVELVRWQRR